MEISLEGKIFFRLSIVVSFRDWDFMLTGYGTALQLPARIPTWKDLPVGANSMIYFDEPSSFRKLSFPRKAWYNFIS